MKNLKDILLEKLKISSQSKINQYHYYPKDKEELSNCIKKLIKERGNNADLNDIDVSKITDMSDLFSDNDGGYNLYNFDGDISEWDVSNVTNMKFMFSSSKFTGKNGDISGWDVSNVKKMDYIFLDCPLGKKPPKWYKK